MNKLILILIFSVRFSAFGQNLTLDELISIRKKSIGYVEEFLTRKNWQLISIRDETSTELGLVDFAYNKSKLDDAAESFLSFYNTKKSSSANKISIQINSVSKYNSYVSRIKKLGYNLIKTSVEDGSVIKQYVKNGLAIKVFVTPTKTEYSTITTYRVLIYEPLDISFWTE